MTTTYRYDDANRLTQQEASLTIGGTHREVYKRTFSWSGDVWTGEKYVDEDPDYGYTESRTLDDKRRVIRDTLVDNTPIYSWQATYVYDDDRVVSGTIMHPDGSKEELTYEYPDSTTSILRQCGGHCDVYTYLAGPSGLTQRIEADMAISDDWTMDLEYDDNGYETLVDTYYPKGNRHERKEITRRSYGAPEVEVDSDVDDLHADVRTYTYEFCSED